MGNAILHFVLVNAISITFGVAVVSLSLFALINRSGSGSAGAVFAVFTALLYLCIPFFGGYLTLVSGIMAFFVQGRYLWMAIVVVIVNILNVLMLSPLLRANAVGAVKAGDYKWALIFIGLAVVQIVIGLVVFARYVEHKKDEALDEPFECIDDEGSEGSTTTI
ncbi:MAG: hypothetical protein HQL70_00140 [Magnetococcales bacterium]|nr:hypothetical protein [Magnetococcales bacterium]